MGIRVLFVDDHELIRSGLRAQLNPDAFEIVGEVENVTDILPTILATKPDVVIQDVRLGTHDTFSDLEAIIKANDGTSVIVFSAFDNPTYIARAAALGAADYILKTAPTSEVVDAMLRSQRGEVAPETSHIHRVRNLMHRRREVPDHDTSLTNREYQVLRHISYGLSNREIGLSLGISIETVKEHVQNILRKVNVSDRTQAAVWAVRRGIDR
jgi:DNA-binding NarL/FixJ family response regulator